ASGWCSTLTHTNLVAKFGDKRHDPRRHQFRLFRAIVHRDAVIRVSRQEETRMIRRPRLDGGDSFEMTEMILGNRPVPANDPMKNGRRGNSERGAQVLAHGLKQTLVRPVENIGPIPAAAHGT